MTVDPYLDPHRVGLALKRRLCCSRVVMGTPFRNQAYSGRGSPVISQTKRTTSPSYAVVFSIAKSNLISPTNIKTTFRYKEEPAKQLFAAFFARFTQILCFRPKFRNIGHKNNDKPQPGASSVIVDAIDVTIPLKIS